jgi:hypothetical protein
LPAQLPFGAHLARHARHFRRERAELVDHRIDGDFQLQNLTFDIDGDLLGQVAIGDGGGDLGDVAHLGRQVAGHRIHAVGQVLPGAGDPSDFGLPTKNSFGADLARHAGHFRGEGAQLIDQGVDGVLHLQDFAFDVDRDLLGEVTVGDGGSDGCDVAHLGGQVAGHQIDIVRQILPGAGDALHLGLPAEFAFGADFAGHTRHFGGE